MARTKIKHRTYNLSKPQQPENVSREAERVLVEEPAQDATTKQPDLTDTEFEDLPNAFLDSQTIKGPADASHSRVEDVSDSGNTCTTPQPEENGFDLSPNPQANGLDLRPNSQENGLDLSPNPQVNGLDLSSKLQLNGLDMSPKPQEHVLDMSVKRQENGFDMTPKLLENGLDMNGDNLESVSTILGRGQECSRTSSHQYQPSSRPVNIVPHYSCDSPLNLAWDSPLKEDYQSQVNNPNFRPITPELMPIVVDEIFSPTTQKAIRTTIRALFPDGPPPPPPVMPVRPVRRPKKGDLPYIVGCTKRPRVPSPKTLTVFQGDPYGITDSTNYQEDEEQCSPAKRGRRGPKGCASLSKSRFNPQSDEIAERLKLHEKIDRLLGRTPKEEPVNYMSKPRSFSPLPSTSTDNETIMKNDKHFSESLNCDNDNFDIDDDEELPEVFWDTRNYKKEKIRKESPLAIIKKIDEDKKSDILTDIDENMNNNDMDEDFAEIEFDKYMPKSKLLYYSDEEDIKPKHEPELSNINENLNDRCPPFPVPFPITSTDVICVDDVYNQGTNNNQNTSTSNLNPASQAPANTATVLRSSNKIARSTATKQSDLVIEVPDVIEPINMSCQASTSRPSLWSEDVQFVSEVRPSERLPRDENVGNISDIQIIQGPSSSQNTIMVPPDLSLRFLIDLSDSYSRLKARNQTRKKSKRQKKENQDIPVVNNENTAPSVNRAQPENASQPVSAMSPAKGLGECPICLENLPPGSIAATTCGHVFCVECIKQSLKNTDRKCPTCRKQLRGVGYHLLFL